MLLYQTLLYYPFKIPSKEFNCKITKTTIDDTFIDFILMYLKLGVYIKMLLALHRGIFLLTRCFGTRRACQNNESKQNISPYKSTNLYIVYF